MKTLEQNPTARSGDTSTAPPALDMKTWVGNPPIAPPAGQFVDRRNGSPEGSGLERRQFTNSHEGLSPEAQEFAMAVDQYKMAHRRRFISYEEILSVVKSMGYKKS